MTQTKRPPANPGRFNTLIGSTGNDTFVFVAGQADGDTVVDFDGLFGVGDSLKFVGYGAGATFTHNDATHWQVRSLATASSATWVRTVVTRLSDDPRCCWRAFQGSRKSASLDSSSGVRGEIPAFHRKRSASDV